MKQANVKLKGSLESLKRPQSLNSLIVLPSTPLKSNDDDSILKEKFSNKLDTSGKKVADNLQDRPTNELVIIITKL